MPDWNDLRAILHSATSSVAPAICLCVANRDDVLWEEALGYLDPEARTQPVQTDTLFDLASVTKLFVTTAGMTLVESGRMALDQPVSEIVPEFVGERPLAPYEDPLRPGAVVEVVPPTAERVQAGRVTFRHLLTHTSGLPAWKPLFKVAGGKGAILKVIHQSPFAYPTGDRVLYSDLGLILLAEAMERLTGMGLDEVVKERVTGPLGLAHTMYLPVQSAIGNPQSAIVNVAPTEFCAWRQRRLIAEVHDENAAALGGVAGHAGLFSTAREVAALGQLYLNGGLGVQPRSSASRIRLLSETTVAEMTRQQAVWNDERRGIGWMLRSQGVSSAGRYFSPKSFGHTGFTGTSLWVDPERELVVALLTNRVYYGRDNAAEILALRQQVCDAVALIHDFTSNGKSMFIRKGAASRWHDPSGHSGH